MPTRAPPALRRRPATSSASRPPPLGQLSYPVAPETQQAWDAADAAVKAIVEKDGLGQQLLWRGTRSVQCAHPLASCRIGDDPTTSACDDRHELRGHPGIFVIDAAA